VVAFSPKKETFDFFIFLLFFYTRAHKYTGFDAISGDWSEEGSTVDQWVSAHSIKQVFSSTVDGLLLGGDVAIRFGQETTTVSVSWARVTSGHVAMDSIGTEAYSVEEITNNQDMTIGDERVRFFVETMVHDGDMFSISVTCSPGPCEFLTTESYASTFYVDSGTVSLGSVLVFRSVVEAGWLSPSLTTCVCAFSCVLIAFDLTSLCVPLTFLLLMPLT